MIKQLFSNSPMKRTFFFICVDVFIFFIALYLAYQLRFNFQVWPEHKVGFWNLVWVFIFIKIVIFYLFKIYFITWRYFVLGDVRKIFFALIVSYLLFAIYLMMLYEGPFPRSAIIIDFLLSFIMIVGIRFSKRVYQDLSKPNSFNPTIIIGANQKAISVINSARDQEINFFPVAIVDENRSMINSYLSNLKVYSCDKLEYLIGKHRINSAIITKEYKSDDTLYAYANELKQAVLNLVKNAQDVLIENKIENPKITISTYKEKNQFILLFGYLKSSIFIRIPIYRVMGMLQ